LAGRGGALLGRAQQRQHPRISSASAFDLMMPGGDLHLHVARFARRALPLTMLNISITHHFRGPGHYRAVVNEDLS